MCKHLICEVINKDLLVPEVYKFTLKALEIAQTAKPGQFLEIKCSDEAEVLLRRPISISKVSKEKGEVEFIFQVKGKGTQALAKKESGDSLDVLGPLGKGFTLADKFNKVAIIGGGIGVFPLYYLAHQLENVEVHTYLGFRNKKMIALEDEFNKVSKELNIATDDGSYEHNGLVTEVFEKDICNIKFDIVYACGPLPMLRKVKDIAIANNIACEISMEERMGCGVGVCLGCACKVKDGEDFKFGHVCKDGPVFRAEEILLD